MATGDNNLAPGTAVGEYRVMEKLGAGSFGDVYAAKHPLIGKRAAIKILNAQYACQPESVSRFVSEARAVNRIRHPNIIDIFDFGRLPDGRQYLVMELLDGETLESILLRRRRLPFEEAVEILKGVADALDAAHAEKIVHRDLKPDNVFVATRHGRVAVKLLDFGIAKLHDDSQVRYQTVTGTMLGTPYFMSPEQCEGKPVDGRADVYSFGIMSFLMLAGDYPINDDSVIGVMMAHITAPRPDIRSFNPSLPVPLSAVFASLLATDPAQRPATAGEAVAMMERAFGSQASVANVATLNLTGPTTNASASKVVHRSPIAASLELAAPRSAAVTLDAVQPVAPRSRRFGKFALIAGPVLALAMLGAAIYFNAADIRRVGASSPAPEPSERVNGAEASSSAGATPSAFVPKVVPTPAPSAAPSAVAAASSAPAPASPPPTAPPSGSPPTASAPPSAPPLPSGPEVPVEGGLKLDQRD